VSAEVKREVARRDGWTCRYCGLRVITSATMTALERRLPAALPRAEKMHESIGTHPMHCVLRLTWDHVDAHGHGGGSTADNVVAACGTCIFQKRALLTDPWVMPLRSTERAGGCPRTSEANHAPPCPRPPGLRRCWPDGTALSWPCRGSVSRPRSGRGSGGAAAGGVEELVDDEAELLGFLGEREVARVVEDDQFGVRDAFCDGVGGRWRPDPVVTSTDDVGGCLDLT
jgi:hypothetical protein